MTVVAGGSTEWRGRSVISKVVALLDAFTPAAPELSLGELARITGLPLSTTYRLVSELVAWGGLLARALAEVRRTGTAAASEEMTLGSESVAVPILDAEDACIAALAVVSRTGRGDPRRLAPAVRTAALSISRALQDQVHRA